MATWPLTYHPTRTTKMRNAASNTNVIGITAGAVANTQGATWTQIIASLAHDVTSFTLSAVATSTAATNTSSLLDLAIGAAGFETPILTNIPVGFLSGAKYLSTAWDIPISLPAGTRISGKLRSAVASKQGFFGIDYFGGEPLCGLSSYVRAVDYGAATASSRGTTVTGSSTVNVKGAWAPLTASTTADIEYLMWGVQLNAATNVTARDLAIDIGVGAAGQEIVVVPDIICTYTANEEVYPYGRWSEPLEQALPAGSRLSARLSSTVASTTADIVVIGLT